MSWNEELSEHAVVVLLATILWEDKNLKREIKEYLIPENLERIEADCEKLIESERVLRDKVILKLEPFLSEVGTIERLREKDIEILVGLMEILTDKAFDLMRARMIHENQ